MLTQEMMQIQRPTKSISAFFYQEQRARQLQSSHSAHAKVDMPMRAVRNDVSLQSMSATKSSFALTGSNLTRAVAASAGRRIPCIKSSIRDYEVNSASVPVKQHTLLRNNLTFKTTEMNQEIANFIPSRRGSRRRIASDPNGKEIAAEWQVAVDPKSKRTYYYHPITRQTTWKKPQQIVDKEQHKKVQFFVEMEQNIRLQYQKGNLVRSDTLTESDTDEQSTPEVSNSRKSKSNIQGTLSKRMGSCVHNPVPESFNVSNAVHVPIRKDTSVPPVFPRTISSFDTAEETGDYLTCTRFIPHLSNRNCVEPAPIRRPRSNSFNDIDLPTSTIDAPDKTSTIYSVSLILQMHLIEALSHPIPNVSHFQMFKSSEHHIQTPSHQTISSFILHIHSMAQMELECIILTLVYVERLLKCSHGQLQLTKFNWRSIIFLAMILASKVWDDLSMCNADFSKINPELSLQHINALELTFLRTIEYNVSVSAVSYAKYYFHLHSLSTLMGIEEVKNSSHMEQLHAKETCIPSIRRSKTIGQI